MTDGEIKLNLSLNTKDAYRTANELRDKIQSILESPRAKGVGDKKLDKQSEKLLLSMKQTANQSSTVSSKLLDIVNGADKGTQSLNNMRKKAQDLRKQLELSSNGLNDDVRNKLGLDTDKLDAGGLKLKALENEVDKLYDKLRKLEKKNPTPEYASLQNDLAKEQEFNAPLKAFTQTKKGKDNGNSLTYLRASEERLANIKSQMDMLEKSGGAYVDKTRQIARTKQAIESVNQKILNQEQANKANHDALSQKLDEEKSKIALQESAVRNTRIELQRQLDTLNNKAAIQLADYNEVENSRKGVSRLTKTMQSLSKAASKVGGVAKSAFKALGDHAKKSAEKGAKSFKQFFKAMIGVRGLFALVRKLKSFVIEGVTNLANFDPGLNKSLSNIVSAFEQLKNAVGAAFSPIIQVIEPIITRIINLFTAAATKVGEFASALFNVPFVKATKVNKKFGESAAKASKSVDKETGSLASFDKLNTISSKDNNDSGSGADPGGGFEYGEVSDDMKDFVNSLKEMWDAADFTELGVKLGTVLRDALRKIPWDEIQEVGKKLGKSLATLLNGFFSVDGLDTEIGNALAQLFNTIVYTIQAFVDNFDFLQFGKFGAGIVNGFFGNVDWAAVAQTVSRFVDGIFETLYGFLYEVDLGAIWDYFLDFVDNLDWAEMLASIGDALGALIGNIFTLFRKLTSLETLTTVIGGVFKIIIGLVRGLGNMLLTFLAKAAKDMGLDTVAGFLLGIKDKWDELWRWVNDLVQKAINWIKDKLGIHSPSTVFSDIGLNLIQGLWNGIKNVWEKLKNWFVNTFIHFFTVTLKDKVTTAWTNIKTSVVNIMNSMKEALKTPINGIIGFMNGLVSGVVNGLNSMINAINKLEFTLPDWVPIVGGKSLGFSIPNITAPQIPMLAQGAVIPPNAPFMAMLGDQRNGTNIEAPLDTIKQAVAEVIGNLDMNVVFDVQGDPEHIFKVVQRQARNYSNRTGNLAF